MTVQDQKKQAINDLIEAFLILEDKGTALNFLKDLCTPQELVALAERWRVCRFLSEGTLSYREIHARTGASLATIVRVARFLKDEPFHGYQAVLKRLKDKQVR